MMVLVTGGGFVGFSLASRLLRQDESVFGIDNLAPLLLSRAERGASALLKDNCVSALRRSILPIALCLAGPISRRELRRKAAGDFLMMTGVMKLRCEVDPVCETAGAAS